MTDKLKQVFIFTFIIGLIAYGFVFTNYYPSHDGYMMMKTNELWELSIGRFVVLYYAPLRGKVEATWLLGILTLTYVAFAVFLTMEVLQIPYDNWRVFVVSSVFVLTIAFISNSCIYIYCWDVYALALLLAVLSVYCFMQIPKYKKWRFFQVVWCAASLMSLALSMGCYQAYYAVAVGLYLIIISKKILDDDTFRNVIIFGISTLANLICSGGLYYLILKICQRINNIIPDQGSYESLSNLEYLTPMGVIKTIPLCYEQVFRYFFVDKIYASNLVCYANMALFLIGITLWGYCIIYRVRNIQNRALLIIILALFPLGINCISILTGGDMFQLMIWSYQLFYIMLLYPLLYNAEISDFRIFNIRIYLPVFLIVVLISIGVVRYSNDILYYQKLVGEGTKAYLTNIIYDIDRTEGFDESTDPVYIVGDISSAIRGDYEYQGVYSQTTGMGYGSTITYNDNFRWYLRYVLGKNYTYDIEPEVYERIENNSEIEEMPCYPEAGYCKMVEDCLVIKFQ
ncbi:MAG: glucosyltransferase domain-containing protein [Lachnospiraceae bacterium]|nr:glucosyltransferase domain-containing protein [Lachnospiraceae bacterium]